MAAIIRLDEIYDKRLKTIELYNKDKLVHTIKFNPYDADILVKFFSIYDKYNESSTKMQELELELKEIVAGETDILGKELETADDFVFTQRAMNAISQSIGIAVNALDETIRTLDEIFGEGTCQLFTRGCRDAELLMPLIDTALPIFEEAYAERRGRVEQAKLNREARRKLAKTGNSQ